MKKITLLGVLAVLCLLIEAQQPPENPGQAIEQNITPLRIGDKIPDALWDAPLQVVNHPEIRETITLSEYKDKLIILDFWATWCVPCIKSLNKLDTLYREFAKDLIIVPITDEPVDVAMPFIKRHGWSLPSVINNMSMNSYFPHASIPHQVWIRNSTLYAVVGPEYSSRENFAAVLEERQLKMIMKEEDRDFDVNKPLFYDGNGGDLKDIKIKSVITPRIKAEIAGINNSTNRILFYNTFALNLIYESVSDDIPYQGRYNRIIWDVSDTLKADLNGNARDITGDYDQDVEFYKWLDENTYCYELTVHPDLKFSKKDMHSIMRSDLQNFFQAAKGIDFRVEMHNVPAYSIIEIDTMENSEMFIKTEDPARYFTLINQPLAKLRRYISAVLKDEEYPFSEVPVPDRLITAQLDKDHLTLEGIRSQLRKFGFDLKLSNYRMKMLVISTINKED